MKVGGTLIYIVALNPSIDYLMELDTFQIGATNRSKKESIFVGGKGINVSIMLNNLGVESTVLGFVSGFTGDFIKEELRKYPNIHTNFIEVKGSTRINIKLNGIEETEINGIGTEVLPDHIGKIEGQLRKLNSEDLVIFSGRVANGMDEAWYAKVIKNLSDKEIPFIIDISSNILFDILPFKPLLIKPNLNELELMYESGNLTESNIIKKGKDLIKKGAKHCIISLGEKGSLFFVDEHVYSSNVPKGTTISSVGAGDSMIAGFIASWQKNKDHLEAYKLASSCGTSTAYSPNLAQIDAIEKLHKRIEVIEIKEQKIE